MVPLVNKIVYEFVWNRKTDKVKCNICEQEYHKGGYKMINVKDITTATSIIWIKKCLDNTEREWKHTLEWLSKQKNLRVFLMSNYDANELPSYLPNIIGLLFKSGVNYQANRQY